MKTLNHEHECYPIVERFYRSMGYFYRRVEGPAGHPDIEVGLGGIVSYREVKLYRGKKSLDYLTHKDIKWRPGQKKFYHDLKKAGCAENWSLFVFDKKGTYKLYSGEELGL